MENIIKVLNNQDEKLEKIDINHLIGEKDGLDPNCLVYNKNAMLEFLRGFPNKEWEDYAEYHLGKNKWFRMEARYFKDHNYAPHDSFAIYYGGSLCLQNPSIYDLKVLIYLLKIEKDAG